MADNRTLVGRDREREHLTRWLDAIGYGARVVTVEGPAGIGKTTLARWAAGDARRRGWTVAVAGATNAELESPFGIWERIGIRAGWEPRPHLEGVESPPGAFRWVVDAIDRADAPTLLVLDDLHAADEGSIALVTQLASFIDEQPIVVMAVLRHAATHPSPRARRLLEVLSAGTETLRVGPLDVTATTEVAIHLGGRAVAEWATANAAELYALTAGSPMAVADLVADLQADAANDGIDLAARRLGDHRAASMVQRQLRTLDARTCEVLSAIAIGAGDGGVSVAARVVGADIRREIDAAVAAGVLRAARAGEPLQFSHPLFAEELRAVAGRSPEIHLRIAHALRDHSVSVSSEVVLLRHLMAAGDHAPTGEIEVQINRALHTARTLGDAAVEVEVLEMRRARNGGVPTTTVLVELADAHYRAGDRRNGRDCSARALAAAANDNDVVLSVVSLSRGADYDAMAPAVASAVEQAIDRVDENHPQRWLLLAILAELSVTVPIVDGDDDRVFNWAVDGGRARGLLTEAAAAFPRDATDEERARLDLAWARVTRDPAHVDARRERLASALSCISDDVTRAEIAGRRAVDDLAAGQRSAVEDALDEIVRISRRRGELRLMWLEQRFRATLALASGDVAAAVQHGQRAFDIGTRADEPARWVTHLAHLVACSLETGEPVRMERPEGPLTHPLFRAGLAWGIAMTSPSTLRESSLRQLVAELHADGERESNWLLKATFVADAAWRCGLVDLAHDLIRLLEPFTHLVATDENAHYCHGAVARPVAGLFAVIGRDPSEMERIGRAIDLEAGFHRFVFQGDLDRLSRRVAAGVDAGTVTELSVLAQAATSAGLSRLGDAAAHLLHPDVGYRLTRRQRTVLTGLASGQTYRQIASEIGYSHSVVRKEAMAVYAALGAAGRNEALDIAAQLGLV